MSDFVAAPVEFEGELRSEIWHELWSFNNCNPPKFWFGQQVKFHDLVGTVMGMEYRPEEMQYGRAGWWYRCRWKGRDSLIGVHENSLVAIAD